MTPSLRNLAAWIPILGIAGARAATFAPSQDTSIAEEAPNALHYGASDTLYTIGVPGFRAYGFLRFDLGSLAGQDVAGDATLGIDLDGQYPENGGGRTVGLWVVNQDWSDVRVFGLENAAGTAWRRHAAPARNVAIPSPAISR